MNSSTGIKKDILPMVSVIILNWNKLDYLKQCIENAVKNTDYPDYEIIIWDNASTEAGTKEYLSSLPHKVILSPVNLGFAKGNNEAVKHAAGEYLLLLNNDTIPERDWLTSMVRLMLDTPGCGIVGSKLLYPDRTIQHVGVYIDVKGIRKHYYKKYPHDIPDAMIVRECEAVTAACFLIKKSVYEKVGGFDERYIQGVEDMDLCFKVRELGYRIFYCPDSVLIHFEGTSWKDFGHKKREKLKRKAVRNNEKLFYEKWGDKIDSLRLEPYHFKFKHRDYFDRDFKPIIKLIPEAARKILDVGCGKGVLGKALKEKGFKEICGIELDPYLAAEAQKHMDSVIIGDIEDMVIPAGIGKFDCIVLADILEHLKDPWTALNKLKGLLSDEGVIIASIPNIRHYRIIKDIIIGRWFYREDGILDGSHLRFFGLKGIKHLFSTASLDITKMKRLRKAEGVVRFLNWLFRNRLEDMITFQYLIVAKKRKFTINENSPELQKR